MNTMYEYILWANCCNSCKFCPQCATRSKDKDLLTDEEKLGAIDYLISRLDDVRNQNDILIIGGELYNDTSKDLSNKMGDLWSALYDKIESNDIRYIYTNTSFMYKDLFLINEFLNYFKPVSEHIKIATSYDISGRFNDNLKKDDNTKNLFQNNLRLMTASHNEYEFVVNTIMTKQFYDVFTGKLTQEKMEAEDFDDSEYAVTSFNLNDIQKDFGVSKVNILPYVKMPCIKTDKFDITFTQIIEVLNEAEKQQTGFIQNHINEFANSQERICFVYDKANGFVNKTETHSKCGHNFNFNLIGGTLDNCYVCKLEEIFGG